ncbi:MAG: hydroxyacylglutathione hydrolase [Gammaproteobacteria bacterium]
MKIETLWVNNDYRNFNYLIACEETGVAMAVDPLDHAQCLQVAKKSGYDIRYVLNTHEHWDHIGGNQAIVDATGAEVIAHHQARIKGQARGLKAGDAIQVGKTVELEILDTPGHTMSHVCAIAHGDRSALFSGDTLFNAGAGNCHNGGHPDELFDTFEQQMFLLKDDLTIYPGHDYLANNLQFTLDREPGNKQAQALLELALDMDPAAPIVTNVEQEREINTFFRLEQREIVEKLCEEDVAMSPNASPRSVFLKLRELRNHW